MGGKREIIYLSLHCHHDSYIKIGSDYIWSPGFPVRGVWTEWGWKREIIYLSLHCHHDSYIKIGSDESHFNVSVGSDGQSHKTMSTNHNGFSEEKGEPKRYRTEVLQCFFANLALSRRPRMR